MKARPLAASCSSRCAFVQLEQLWRLSQEAGEVMSESVESERPDNCDDQRPLIRGKRAKAIVRRM